MHATDVAADDALAQLFAENYARLARVAAVLLKDPSQAEDIVQDAFVAMHGSFDRLADREAAAGYLYRAVVNRCRSRLRHLKVVDRKRPDPPPDVPSAEETALNALSLGPVSSAIRALPRRQREAVLLRHYLDLSEADAATAMGVSVGGVKSAASRGLAAIRSTLEGAR